MGNSATVGDGIVFDYLNLTPVKPVDNDKPSLTAVTIVENGQPVDATLVVTKDVLSATTATTTYAGQALIGLTMTIAMFDGRAYDVRLVGVTPTGSSPPPPDTSVLMPSEIARFWVSPYDTVQSYSFLVRKTHVRNTPQPGAPDDGPISPAFSEHLCKGPYRTVDDRWTGYESALAFTGDHFDGTTKAALDLSKPSGPPPPPGFHLACAGTAAAKMHLMRHTDAGSIRGRVSTKAAGLSPSRTTTLDQRTAMLKAITADYCGDGGQRLPRYPWTADGTPLAWMDDRGWYPDISTRQIQLDEIRNHPDWVEAIWTVDGAICLNDPRRKPGPNASCPSSYLRFPAVEHTEVDAYCTGLGRGTLPSCDEMDVLAWIAQTKGYVITVNRDSDANYCPD